MLTLVFAISLTAVLLVKLGFRRGRGREDLGSMSPHWIAAYRASQHASTI
jgi:hypothetical protein